MRRILSQMTKREVDILVGTQMVTKGHDFSHVTLVGVVAADLSLHFPDFRAAERTFQLLTQVAGRAGRGERLGRVLIQTYNPDHASLRHARTHDYCSFFDEEIVSRRELNYPPAGHVVLVRVDGKHPHDVEQAGKWLAERGRETFETQSSPGGVDLLGPAEAPLSRLKGRTRWLLLLKGDRSKVRQVVSGMLRRTKDLPVKGVRVTVDVDPLMML